MGILIPSSQHASAWIPKSRYRFSSNASTSWQGTNSTIPVMPGMKFGWWSHIQSKHTWKTLSQETCHSDETITFLFQETIKKTSKKPHLSWDFRCFIQLFNFKLIFGLQSHPSKLARARGLGSFQQLLGGPVVFETFNKGPLSNEPKKNYCLDLVWYKTLF